MSAPPVTGAGQAASGGSTIVLAKSKSSSSVLSSVSLASGVQMRPALQPGQTPLELAKLVSASVSAPSEPAPGELEPVESEQEVAVARDPQIQTPKPRINELKKLLRHTNSLNQLPEFGVETEQEPELKELMQQIDVWGLNIFEVHLFSQQHSLTAVMYKIFRVSMGPVRLHLSSQRHALTSCSVHQSGPEPYGDI